jgi:hypothetical protein
MSGKNIKYFMPGQNSDDSTVQKRKRNRKKWRWIHSANFWIRMVSFVGVVFAVGFFLRWQAMIPLLLLIFIVGPLVIVWAFLGALSTDSGGSGTKSGQTLATTPKMPLGRSRAGRLLAFFIIGPIFAIPSLMVGFEAALAITPYSASEIAENELLATEAANSERESARTSAAQKAAQVEAAELKAAEEKSAADKKKAAELEAAETDAVVTNVPDGFSDWGNGIGFKALTGEGACSSGTVCLYYQLYAYKDCPSGVYIQANFINAGGVIVGYGTDLVGSMRDGDSAVVDLRYYGSASKINITKISCY